MNEFDITSWRNKVVLVYVRNSPAALENGIVLFCPELHSVNGKEFLIGKTPEDSRDWLSGLPSMVSWQEVSSIIIFDSLEDYKIRLESAPVPHPLPPKSDIN